MLQVHYMKHIDFIKHFIRAERRGNQLVDLAATEKMLNLYAATRHDIHVKSARFYLWWTTFLRTILGYSNSTHILVTIQ